MTTWLISASTSSIPATSANVTLTVSGSTGFRARPPRIPPPERTLLAPEHPDVRTRNNGPSQGVDREQSVGQHAAFPDERLRFCGGPALHQFCEQVVGGEGGSLGGELVVLPILLVGQCGGIRASSLD